MTYIRLPDLQVQPVRQRYTAGASDDPQMRAFHYQMLPGKPQDAVSAERYHGAGSGFSAQLLVDSDGLVLHYPPYWRRAGMQT